MKKITIITVVYNSEKYIKDTIESVLKQTYENVEYIIIDGGSNDKTMDIVNSYSGIDVVISESDSGIYDAMNKGIKLSHGQWINFMNSGDVFHSDTVVADIFTSKNINNYGLIYGNVNYYSLEQNINYAKGGEIKFSDLYYDMPICHQSMFVKKKVFEKIGVYDKEYKVIADYEHLVRIYQDTSIFKKYFDIVISDFLIDGFGKNNEKEGLFEHVILSKKYFKKSVSIFTHALYLIKYFRLLISYFLQKLSFYKLLRKIKYRFNLYNL
jgi:glycosyltransferase involved in cell wall biosynthesis